MWGAVAARRYLAMSREAGKHTAARERAAMPPEPEDVRRKDAG